MLFFSFLVTSLGRSSNFLLVILQTLNNNDINSEQSLINLELKTQNISQKTYILVYP